jgi:helicase
LLASLFANYYKSTAHLSTSFKYDSRRGTIVETIATPTSNSTINLALDTIKQGKQALIFCNTKRGAEKTAEEIGKKIKDIVNQELADRARKAMSKPTKQCERLARCLRHGVAFHHAGLYSKQKDLVEGKFREKEITIIACTPTLAAGLNLPAYRAIIRDVKRFAGRFGMRHIPVLEYLQMAGRAGRPGHDPIGQAIIIASSQADADDLTEMYIEGEPEAIQSKLNVEPVMRTYLLSLISSKLVRTKEQIIDFFKETFWAYQFKDMSRLTETILFTLRTLVEWEFLEKTETGYRATQIGRRVAELYLDPLTANHLIKGIKRAEGKQLKATSFLQLISHTIEMYPLLRVKNKEFSDIQAAQLKMESHLLDEEPSMFDIEYEDWLNSIKTTLLFCAWIEETTEDIILEQFNVRPGELHGKNQVAIWLLYSMSELASLLGERELVKEIYKIRTRVQNGVKEELLPLLKLKGIGRVKARKLFRAGFTRPVDMKKDPNAVQLVLGKKLGASVLEQIGHGESIHKGRLSDFA